MGAIKTKNGKGTIGNSEQFVVDGRGRKTSVIIPMREYQRLLEDMHDLAVVAERREEKPISLQEMKSRLKKNGRL